MTACVCTHCGAEYVFENEEAAFCSKCGHRLVKADGVRTGIAEALAIEDTRERYEKLLALRKSCEDEYSVEFEILCIGRMHERGGKPDFYRIPFWPLAAYETPGQFSKKERSVMLKSFFENEEAERVMRLAPDAEEFRKEYYFRMARGYVDLCLKGNNSNSTFWGFKRKPAEVKKRCALALEKMLANIRKADYPGEYERGLLTEAFEKAFEAEFASVIG